MTVKAYLARLMPVLVATATPFIIALLKEKRPDWKEKYREQWPYVAALIGIVLNLLGLSIAPEMVFADASGGLATVDPVTSTVASAAVGYVSGLGASKQRDLRRGRHVCEVAQPAPVKRTKAKRKRRTKHA